MPPAVPRLALASLALSGQDSGVLRSVRWSEDEAALSTNRSSVPSTSGRCSAGASSRRGVRRSFGLGRCHQHSHSRQQSQERCRSHRSSGEGSEDGNSLRHWAAEVASTPRPSSVPASPRLPGARARAAPTPRTCKACFPGAGPELAAELLQRRSAEEALQNFDLATDDETAVDVSRTSRADMFAELPRKPDLRVGENSVEILELRLDIERIVQQVIRPLARHLRMEMAAMQREIEVLRRRHRKKARAPKPQAQLEQLPAADSLQMIREEEKDGEGGARPQVPAAGGYSHEEAFAEAAEVIINRSHGAEPYQLEPACHEEELLPDLGSTRPRPSSPTNGGADEFGNLGSTSRQKLGKVEAELSRLEASMLTKLQMKADASYVEDALQGHEVWMEKLSGWLEQLGSREEALRELLRQLLDPGEGRKGWMECLQGDAAATDSSVLTPASASDG